MREAASEFDDLVEEFYQVWLRFHPDAAAAAGLEGYEGLLPAVDDDDIGALTSWLESLVVDLEAMDYSALDADRQLDLQWLFGAVQSEHYSLLERDWRHRDPLGFLPFRIIFHLALEKPEKLPARLESLFAGVPEYLRRARAQLSSIPELVSRTLLQAALDRCASGRQYLLQFGGSLVVKRYCHNANYIRVLCEEAAEAVEEFSAFLTEYLLPCAAGDSGIGVTHYRRLLRHRHFLDVSLDSVLAELNRLYKETHEELVCQSTLLGISADPAAIHLFFAEQQVFSGESRLQVYREESNNLRQYVIQHALYSPPPVQLRLLERPICPHPGHCFDGYLSQISIDGAGVGVFYVATEGAEDSGAGRESRVSIRSRCISATWGGQHLLAFPAGVVNRSMVRRLNKAEEFAGAWDLYVRQLLDEQGYFGKEDRLLMLALRRDRLRQAQADLMLHLGQGDIAKVRELLADTELDSGAIEQSQIDILRYPTDRLASILGWRLLIALRETLQSLTDEFELRTFHDALLEQGAAPVPLLVQRLYSPDIWQAARRKVLR